MKYKIKKYIVYKITCRCNNKYYVGQTYHTLQQRLQEHFSTARSGVVTKFYNAIRKYGEENFFIEELDVAKTQDELNEKEYYWIKKLDAVNSGLNSKNALGKCGGDTLSNHPNKEEISRKISSSKIGKNNPNSTSVKAFNPFTEQELFFDSMAEACKYFNIDNHIDISRRCRGRISYLYNGLWAFAYADDSYQYTYNKNIKRAAKVNVINIVTNEAKVYNSFTDAERSLKLPRGTIYGKLYVTKSPNEPYKNKYIFERLN